MGREGVVVVERETAVFLPEHRITGHWEALAAQPDGTEDDPTIVDGPGWASIDEAIAWARHRAPHVLLSVDDAVERRHPVTVDGLPVLLHAPPEHVRTTWSCGASSTILVDVETAEPVAPPRPWPGAGGWTDGPLHRAYGGLVQLWVHTGSLMATGLEAAWWTFDAHAWQAAVREERRAELVDLDDLLAWARARAEIVLVGDGHPTWEYWSAGEREPSTPLLPGYDLLLRHHERDAEAHASSGYPSHWGPITGDEPRGRQFPPGEAE